MVFKSGRFSAGGIFRFARIGTVFVLLFLNLSCGGGSGSVSSQAALSDNLTLNGRFINTSSPAQGQPPPSCQDERVLCSVSVKSLSGSTLLSQQVTAEGISYCGDLPENGATFSLGSFSLDPNDSVVKKGFEIACSCQRASGGTLEGFFNKFSGGGTAILGPDGKLDYTCSLENTFLDLSQGDGHQALLAAGCGSIIAFQFLLNAFCAPTDPPTDPGFFCGPVFDLVNQTFSDQCEITFCEQQNTTDCNTMADCPEGKYCLENCCQEGSPKDFCVGCAGNCVVFGDQNALQYCIDPQTCDPDTTLGGFTCGGFGQQVCDNLSPILSEERVPLTCDGTCCQQL